MRLNRLSLLAALVAACSGATSPTLLAVDVSAAPASFRAGDTATITIRITNKSRSPVAVNANECPYSFAVYDARGNTVAPGRDDCFAVGQTRILQPDESFDLVNRWNGEVFRPVPGQIPVYVPPGQYRLEGRVTISGAVFTAETTIEIR